MNSLHGGNQNNNSAYSVSYLQSGASNRAQKIKINSSHAVNGPHQPLRDGHQQISRLNSDNNSFGVKANEIMSNSQATGNVF